jgi:hypothetical protein
MAARYIASITSRSDLEKISKDKLQKYCEACKVNLCQEGTNGNIKIWPEEKHELMFLKVLDKRLLELDLTDETEYFEAANRKQLRI